MTDTQRKRWSLSIIYDTEAGPVVVDHEIEEIEETQDIVERGPDWNSILDITIQLNRVTTPGLKVPPCLPVPEPDR